MRRISLSVCASLTLLLSTGLFAADPQAVDWHTDYAAARAQSEELGLPLLLHFYGTHCPPCKVMEREVFNSPEFRKAIPGNYVIAKLEAGRNRAVAERFRVASVPADLILSPAGDVLFRREGYQSGGGRMYLASLAKYRGDVPAQSVKLPATDRPVFDKAVAEKPVADRGIRNPTSRSLPPTDGRRVVERTVPASSPARVAENPRGGRTSTETRVGDKVERLVPLPNDPVRLPENDDEGEQIAAELKEQAPRVRERSGESRPVRVARVEEEPVAEPAPRKKKVAWGLDGYSAVSLKKSGTWIAGDDTFVAEFRGRKFRFKDQGELDEFQSQPELYSPQGGGLDLVVFEETGRNVPGSTKFGAFYNGQLYLFQSRESRTTFKKNPAKYAKVREGAWRLDAERLASAELTAGT